MQSRVILILSVMSAATVSGLVFAAESSQATVLDSCFAGHPTTLNGVLSIRREYGAPGWGEDPTHDSSWTMVVLKVSTKQAEMLRKIMPGCFNATSDLTEVQLWSVKGTSAFSKYNGLKINVTGMLTAATGAPAQILDAQMSVDSISKYEGEPNKKIQVGRPLALFIN